MYCCFKLKKFLSVTAVFIAVTFIICIAAVKKPEKIAAVSAEDNIFLPVIMYHSLLKDPARAGDYVLSPDVFKADMNYLTENGYTTVFVSDILNYIENGEALPEKPVIVTFDDGYYNVMEYALPFMRENGIKGVINIVGAYSEQSFEEGGHNPTYSYLTWEDISELDKSGVFEIGNHTYDMHSLNGRKGCRRLYSENAEEYRTALFEDTGGLQDILEEKSGVRPVAFAYPFGFISDESTDILEAIGFKVLLTCYEKPNYISRRESGECLILNRYNRPSGTETEKFFEKILNSNEKHENK